MRHYEVVVVLSPILNQEQAAEAWERIKNFISNRNGDITHEEKWGTRRLAYPIRKGSHQFLEGSYHLTRFSTESPFNRELETFLHVDEEVLRSLVVVTDPPGPAPQPPTDEEVLAAVAVAEAEAAAGEQAVVDANEAVAEVEEAAGEQAVVAAIEAVAEAEEAAEEQAVVAAIEAVAEAEEAAEEQAVVAAIEAVAEAEEAAEEQAVVAAIEAVAEAEEEVPSEPDEELGAKPA